ncbi:carbonic anhydrase [Aggregicoccus sp. 17bor-14]|uniref:carbonic anhydrase n=1 Tax=Myxococcaceae TaxID=31 RepID=UPI00129CE101|nr:MULTISPECIES: carbonic anhydrase [Myxococcaceae]MBF5041554.1 carbonic anhydrase [Simulacricoccus sp. 17bor-14]MRI87339.1 carbonic anhydrase [Aggregicoccus sp. 17bor-14]
MSRALLVPLVASAALAQAPVPHASPDAGPDGATSWRELQQGNQRYLHEAPERRDSAARRAETAQAQHPKAAVLSCSDSRVPPEQIFDQGVGDLFVVRAAGEVADTAAIASLEYAVAHLGTRLIVVLGHERCGAVAAAASREEPESPNLASLVDDIAPALAPLPESERAGIHGVEANVNLQADRLLAKSELLRRAVQEGRVTLVREVYDLDTGEVHAISPATHATVH